MRGVFIKSAVTAFLVVVLTQEGTGQAQGLNLSFEIADSVGSVGTHSSIILGDDGFPMIGYYAISPTVIGFQFVRRNASGWQRPPSIIRDGTLYAMEVTAQGGTLHYAFTRDATGIRIYYGSVSISTLPATFPSTELDDSILPSADGYFQSLALDPVSGVPHLIYLSNGTVPAACPAIDANRVVHRWKKPDGSFGCARITSGAVQGMLDLTIDANRYGHATYIYHNTANDTFLGYRRSANPPTDLATGAYTWLTGTGTDANSIQISTGSDGTNDGRVAIATDSSGLPHICFFDPVSNSVKYWGKFQFGGSSAWLSTPETIDSSVFETVTWGDRCDIAVKGGFVHVVYFSRVIEGLKYARKQIGNASATWQIFTLDTPSSLAISPDGVGNFASLVLGGDQTVHVSYYDDENDQLKYVKINACGNLYCGDPGETSDTCPTDCPPPPVPEPQCRANTDCPGLSACIGGRCQSCTDNTQCETGRICQEGACVIPPVRTGCTRNDECPGGAICDEGTCVSCMNDAECGEGMVCQRGACITPDPSLCGNGVCNPEAGENMQTCLVDCPGTITPGETPPIVPPVSPPEEQPQQAGGRGCGLIREP